MAARDVCVAFYSYKDIEKLEKFLQGKPVAEQEIGKQLLAGHGELRRDQHVPPQVPAALLRRNAEGDNCGSCDNCMMPKESFEATDDLELVLQAVKESKERHRAKFICDLLTGTRERDQELQRRQAGKLRFKGREKDTPPLDGRDPPGRRGRFPAQGHRDLRQPQPYRAGKKFLKKPFHQFYKERDYTGDSPTKAMSPVERRLWQDDEADEDAADLRQQVWRKHKLAPYVIFQDPSLEEMTIRYPITIEELTQVSGVGPGKAQKYGKPFVELIARYVEENDIERAEEVVVRSVVNKSGNKVHIIQNIDKRLPLESIAKAKNLT
jgi:ATP-dependent DNA helicase RecQ